VDDLADPLGAVARVADLGAELDALAGPGRSMPPSVSFIASRLPIT